jgi:hypothetical protein
MKAAGYDVIAMQPFGSQRWRWYVMNGVEAIDSSAGTYPSEQKALGAGTARAHVLRHEANRATSGRKA